MLALQDAQRAHDDVALARKEVCSHIAMLRKELDVDISEVSLYALIVPCAMIAMAGQAQVQDAAKEEDETEVELYPIAPVLVLLKSLVRSQHTCMVVGESMESVGQVGVCECE